MRRLVSIVLFGMLCALAAGAARGPSPAAAQPATANPGEAVRIARLRLTRIPVEEMNPTVTPEAQAAIEALKDAILAFVTSALRRAHGDPSAEAVQHLLSAQGGAYVDRAVYSADNFPSGHGNGLVYEVVRPLGHPRLLAVVARLAIECGDDGVLMLFERSGAGWRPLLVRRSPPYREISGAYGDLRFALSPPDRNRAWYVATAHVPPWCTSAWRSVDYDLSRPGAAPGAPRIFFQRRVGTYLGNDSPGTLEVRPGRFQVRHDGGIFDSSIIVRRHVETYAVTGDRVERVQPVAFNVRDFVDEWIAAPWVEASAWSVPALADAHRGLAELSAEFGPIRRCADGRHQVQIDVAHGETWYLLVRGTQPYSLEAASHAPLATCRGADLRPRFNPS